MYLIDGLQQQLAAYISWVNSQLKRKPGLNPITDLRHDLQDGVVLTQLIEIVGKYTHAKLHTQMPPIVQYYWRMINRLKLLV